jgi:N-methylhydantoinase B
MPVDAVRLEVFRHLFASIAEEMGGTLLRSSFSANIKERRDFSCAVFDGAGRLVAQAAHIPVHLGATPMSVRAAIDAVAMGPGDVVILNDPFAGGTHLPDVTLVAPVFSGDAETPLFHVANRAHHADIGGANPGSMSLSTSIHEEGLRIPPVVLMRQGEIVPDVVSMLLANVRTPDERRGDLLAQVAACRRGASRLVDVARSYGDASVQSAMDALRVYSNRRMRALISEIPDGTYCFEDVLEDDGAGTLDIPIRVAVTVDGDEVVVDFDGTHPQVPGNVNANEAVTMSAVMYVFTALAGPDVPANEGCFSPLTVRAPRGTVVHAVYPAAVAGGNVETSQRIVDVVFGALAQALPDRVPAASCGSMSNLSIGGTDRDGRPFTYYETIAGGMGARPDHDGLDGVQTHMTNTRNTPIEALEMSYPMLVRHYGLRRGSGGEGRRRGGDGLVREIEILVPATVGILSERRRCRPYGLQGGAPGQPGRNTHVTADGRDPLELPGKVVLHLSPGDRVRIETPGGGGFGSPDFSRPRTTNAKVTPQ